MKLALAALLFPAAAFAQTPPPPWPDYPEAKKLRDIKVHATIYKYSFISNDKMSYTDRKVVCDVDGTAPVYDTRGNTEGIEFPTLGTVGSCRSTNGADPVEIRIEGHMYEGWNAVPWKKPGKSVYTAVYVKNLRTNTEDNQSSEAGSSDPQAKSIITTTRVGDEGYAAGKPFEYFGADVDYQD